MNIAIVLAGGVGSRFYLNSKKGEVLSKVCEKLNSFPMLFYSIDVFHESYLIDKIIVVINEEMTGWYLSFVEKYFKNSPKLLPYVIGGKERFFSSKNGIDSIKIRGISAKYVAIHDAARPFVKHDLLKSLIEKLETTKYDGVIPVVPLNDSIKQCVQNGEIMLNVDRNTMVSAQTPQCFRYETLKKSFDSASFNATMTDDASVVASLGFKITTVFGDIENKKITYFSDMKQNFDSNTDQTKNFEWNKLNLRIGEGCDFHKFCEQETENAFVMLGGCKIPYKYKVEAHSDGDVVLHSLTDAILGSIGMEDIGYHFSDKDSRWKGAESTIFVQKAMEMLKQKGGVINNIDLTIICEKPKINEARFLIKQSIAKICQLNPDQVNVKGKTTEKMGFLGRGEGVGCFCNVLVTLN